MDRLSQLAADFKAEQARIETLRMLPWSSAGAVEEVIPGVDLLPLTFRAWLDLKLAESPVIVGGRAPARADCGVYLWRVSAGYRPTGCAAEQAREAFIDRIAHLTTLEMVLVCQQHRNDALFDIPAKGGRSSKLPIVDPIVSIVEELAGAYSQDPDAVMDWPVAKGFGLARSLFRRTVPDYKAPRAPSLFALSNAYAAELNRRMQEEEAADGE